LRAVVLGGVFYSIGAVLNLTRLRLWVFSAHEVMHLCVMAGSLSHYLFMLNWVVPYDRKAALARVAGALPDAAAEPDDFPAELAPAQSAG
jgi:hypothetical protein